jgi:hypothetical protein
MVFRLGCGLDFSLFRSEWGQDGAKLVDTGLRQEVGAQVTAGGKSAPSCQASRPQRFQSKATSHIEHSSTCVDAGAFVPQCLQILQLLEEVKAYACYGELLYDGAGVAVGMIAT